MMLDFGKPAPGRDSGFINHVQGGAPRSWPMSMFLVAPSPSSTSSAQAAASTRDGASPPAPTHLPATPSSTSTPPDERRDAAAEDPIANTSTNDTESPTSDSTPHQRPLRRSVLAGLITSSIRPSVSLSVSSCTPPPSVANPNPAPRTPPTTLPTSLPSSIPVPSQADDSPALRLVLKSFGDAGDQAEQHQPPPPEKRQRRGSRAPPPQSPQRPLPATTGSTGPTPMTNGRKRAATGGGGDEPQRYKKRPYGHSCLACRERKIKCEEVETPPCRGCRETNTVCEPVERVRVPRQTKDTEAVLADFEKRIRRLEGLADGGSLSGQSNAQAQQPAKQEVSSGPPSTAHPPGPNRRQEHEEPRRGGAATVTVGTVAPPGEVLASGSSDAHDDAEHAEDTLGRPQYHLGNSARPVYHGELSMFDDSGTRPTAPASPRFDSTSPANWTEERLRAAARLRHRYATADEAEQWLDTYFSWASPVYAVVHRPLFIRDMALDGPYFSEFLLIVIYISGIRFSAGLSERERAQRGEQYVSLAMSMLAEETMAPGRIPTIQALLGLAGRQGAVGKTNQAWMLTGMAIRMMQDMGLHLPVDQDVAAHKFSAEERDMRNRLFWSAYCWDKTMSLTLGREPSLASRPGFTPDSLPEDPDDETDWSPCLPEGALPLERPYPKRKLLKTFTLRHSSALNLILESILTNMYSPSRPNARSLSFIRSAIDRLDTWRKQLPAEIKIEAHSLPAVSPPANVVILNLLYHTIRILIYRPLLTANSRSALASSALTHCRNASAETGAVLSLWGQTFGHFNHHFLFVYCCFISAGVDIILIRTGNPFVRDEAFQRVHVSLDILEQASTQGPGIRRGIASIRAQLDRATKGEVTFPKEPAFDIERGAASPPPDELINPSGMIENAANTAHTHAAAQVQQDMQWFTDGDLWDHQTLLDILSAAPISTEDPFAFTEQSLLPF